jgi:hypothetical protein
MTRSYEELSFYNPHLSAMDTNWIVLAVMPQGDQA